MIYVLDRNEKVVGLLQNDTDRQNPNIYFDDLHTENLATGAETFSFTCILDKGAANNVNVGNFIAFSKNNSIRLMQIIETEEDKEEILVKHVYCETVGLELSNFVYDGNIMENVDIKRFLQTVLQDTDWKVGYIDSNLTTNLALKIEPKEIYSLIQEHISAFGAEIRFRAEIKNNRIVGRYIDAFAKRGKNTGARLEVNRDIKKLVRKVDLSNYATKLIGVGKNNLSFKDITMSEIDKPLGQNFIVNEKAFERLNYKGKHITKKFEYDTTDPYELLKQTKKALDEVSKPQITYEIDSNIMDFSDKNVGDTLVISDMNFVPPLTITARIGILETSKSNPLKNKATLTNFKEIKSGLSKFPIGSNDIIDGAITESKIDSNYTNGVVTSSVEASIVQSKVLIAGYAEIMDAEIKNLKADKADITDLNAVNAEIKNLKVDKADIVDLNATNAEIENLKVDKADVSKLNAVDAEIKNLKADKANVTDLEAINVNIENLKANKADIVDLNATNANITNLTANVGKIETLVNGNLTSDNVQAGGITSDRLTISDGFIKDAMIEDLNASKIKAGAIDTNLVEVKSTDGKLLIKDNTIQIMDNSRVRVQIGKDSLDDYSMSVWDVDGKLMFDARGLTEDAIKTEIIRNDMISNNANISGSKLDINSVIETINTDGTKVLNSSKIKLDELNQTLDIAFKTLKTQADSTKNMTESNLTKINVQQGQINTAIENTLIDKNGEKLLLKDEYSKLEQNVGEIKTTVGSHTSELSELGSRVTANNSSISQMEKEISLKVSQSEVDTAKQEAIRDANGYTDGVKTSMNNQISEIKTNLNSVNLKVEKTETETEKLNTKVNNIKVGNRNLLLKSSVFPWSGTDTTDNSNIETSGVLNISSSASRANAYIWLMHTTESFNKLSVKPNFKSNEYTLSIDVKTNLDIVSSKVDITLDYWNSSNSIIKTQKVQITDTQNEWKRYSITMPIVENEDITKVLLCFNVAVDANVTKLEYRNVSFTLGNMLSDWTPAPEDIQSNIDNVQNNLDNLSIGGRNLILNSDLKNGMDPYVITNTSQPGTIELVEFQGKQCIKFTNMGYWDVSKYFRTPNFNILKGQKAVFSADIYLTSGAYISVDYAGVLDRGDNHITVPTLNTWYRLSAESTSEAKVDGTAAISLYAWGRDHKISGYMTLLKVEIGNKATDWTPAPEDLFKPIDGLTTEISETKKQVSNIDINLGKITSKVENNEVKTANIEKFTLLKDLNNFSASGTLDRWNKSGKGETELVTDQGFPYALALTTDDNATMLSDLIEIDSNANYKINLDIKSTEGSSGVKGAFSYYFGIYAFNKDKQSIAVRVCNPNEWSSSSNAYFVGDKAVTGDWKTYTGYLYGSTLSESQYNYNNLYRNNCDRALKLPKEARYIQVRFLHFRGSGYGDSKQGTIFYANPNFMKIDDRFLTTETRLKTAEMKLEDDSITAVVAKNFYTKNDIDGKKYQTSSEVQQKVDSLQIKFSESGGYNRIYKSKIMETSNKYGFGLRYIDGSLMTAGKTYTLTVNGRTVNNSGEKYCNVILYDSQWKWSKSVIIKEQGTKTKSVTFTLPDNIDPNNLRLECYHYPDGGDRTGSSRVNWVCLTDGSLPVEWSPHPSEIYQGITSVDKDGVTVTSSNVNSKTSMSANGFKITKTNTNEDVFNVNSNGDLNIKGNITAIGGSISGSIINGGTINGRNVNITNLNAENITTGTFSGDRIHGGVLDGVTIRINGGGMITNQSVAGINVNCQELTLNSNAKPTEVKCKGFRVNASSKEVGNIELLTDGSVMVGGSSGGKTDFYVNYNKFSSPFDGSPVSGFKSSSSGAASVAGIMYAANFEKLARNYSTTFTSYHKKHTIEDHWDILNSIKVISNENGLDLSISDMSDEYRTYLNPCLSKSEFGVTIDTMSIFGTLINSTKDLKQENTDMKKEMENLKDKNKELENSVLNLNLKYEELSNTIIGLNDIITDLNQKYEELKNMIQKSE